MAASSVRVSKVPCTAMYRATAPAAPATASATPASRLEPDVPLAPGPVVHPSLQRVHPPLRLGLGQVDPERLDLGDALEVLADQRHLGLAVDVARVELVQELCGRGPARAPAPPFGTATLPRADARRGRRRASPWCGNELVYPAAATREATSSGAVGVVPRRPVPGLAVPADRSLGAGGARGGARLARRLRTPDGGGPHGPRRPRPLPAGERAPASSGRSPGALAVLGGDGLGHRRERRGARRLPCAVVQHVEGVPLPALRPDPSRRHGGAWCGRRARIRA